MTTPDYQRVKLSQDPAELRIQAGSLVSLSRSLQEQRDWYMAECKKLRANQAEPLMKELSAERATNELLTKQLEEAEAEIEWCRGVLRDHGLCK